MEQKVLLLEELVREQVNESVYGLKTAGLVKLNRLLSELNLPKYIKVPDFFAIPVSIDLESPYVKTAYQRLVSKLDSHQIILARSSDPEEKPGKFETHSSLFQPEKPEESYNNWIDAAKKVKLSGARALIGQPLAAQLEQFSFDRKYDGESRPLDKTVASFGGSNTSFFLNSTSFLRGDYPLLVACFGLGSKIARGDKDVCLIEEGPNRTSVVALNHNYYSESFTRFEQEKIDLVTLKKPSRISSINYDTELQTNRYSLFQHSMIPFDDLYRFFMEGHRGEDFQWFRFGPDRLLDIVNKLKKRLEKPFEIEGCLNENGIYLVQLREYNMPQRGNFELTEVVKENILFKSKKESIGFNKFKGDLYLSDRLIEVPEGSIFMYDGDNIDKVDLFCGYKQIVIPFPDVGGRFETAHAFGRTVQIILELERSGIKAIALGDSDNTWVLNHPEKTISNHRYQRLDNSTVIYKNVTVECNGDDAQIFFNK